MNASIRILWLTIFALVSLVLAILCGIWIWARSKDPQAAIVAGGATFAGTLTLLIASAGFVEQS